MWFAIMTFNQANVKSFQTRGCTHADWGACLDACLPRVRASSKMELAAKLPHKIEKVVLWLFYILLPPGMLVERPFKLRGCDSTLSRARSSEKQAFEPLCF